MADIRRRYGDHLYAKHDYDAAMAQYAATTGFMEPSYVIRRFLDAQRIHNLTSYLEELHSEARPAILSGPQIRHRKVQSHATHCANASVSTLKIPA